MNRAKVALCSRCGPKARVCRYCLYLTVHITLTVYVYVFFCIVCVPVQVLHFLTQLCLSDLFSDKRSPCEDWPVMMCHVSGRVKEGEQRRKKAKKKKRGKWKVGANIYHRVERAQFFPTYIDLISTLLAPSAISL